MVMHKTLSAVLMVMAATAGWAAEAAKEPPPAWPWPGPTPPEIRDGLVQKRNIFRPTEQDLRKMARFDNHGASEHNRAVLPTPNSFAAPP